MLLVRVKRLRRYTRETFCMHMNYNTRKGFTLIELLVVISIIGLLSTVVFTSVNSARDTARVSHSAAQVREVLKAIALYIDDTGRLPPNCRIDCTQTADPFLNSLGIAGWRGPYIATGIWNMKHGWGGHIGLHTDLDFTGDSIPDAAFVLDDDRPGTNGSDNQGIIPAASLMRLDQLLDDGNLATGTVRGNGLGFFGAAGELVILFTL